ncbi:rCG42090 [Rattus norvegicus]|uniref:RCG42090 n=1 Tax=Rattus norvegicus TaxID=10116 RepID=A6JV05_RAT|nr:rCG42090 [Rattus norvegicus]
MSTHIMKNYAVRNNSPHFKKSRLRNMNPFVPKYASWEPCSSITSEMFSSK